MNRREFLQTSAGGIGGIALSVVPVHGQQDTDPNPKVVSQFAPPKPNARGITFDGESLWVGHEKDNGDLIYELGTDGRIKQSFSFPGDDTMPDIYGITAMNDHLFAVGDEFILHESRQPVLYKITKQGERVTRYETSGSFGYQGIANDGTRLFVSKGEQIVRVLTTAANQYRSIGVPQEFQGLCYDGTDFWGTANANIFRFTSDGTVKQRFSYPADYGIGIAHDGRYLYMIDKDQNRIFKLDPDVAGGNTEAGPSTQQPDSDGDGISDSQDENPQKPSTARSHRTEQDSDGDGVPDSDDYAPDDPEVQAKSDLEESGSSGIGPGFGPFSALAALGGASAYFLKKRMTDE
ncbi:hypothetical protein SAMN05216388_101812 [Halorientalis persicus]|uniref:Uncharacterized protein n=1 Tax=Halorientalis persicus TaxID=1367881 RepID=A0A1H8S658_9EURY|nr:hypothetical protein [Halorientalis persicus]SEO74499.1 hypothetical protein SAMN05216388_101812 [Halorientalis persicus]